MCIFGINAKKSAQHGLIGLSTGHPAFFASSFLIPTIIPGTPIGYPYLPIILASMLASSRSHISN